MTKSELYTALQEHLVQIGGGNYAAGLVQAGKDLDGMYVEKKDLDTRWLQEGGKIEVSATTCEDLIVPVWAMIAITHIIMTEHNCSAENDFHE